MKHLKTLLMVLLVPTLFLLYEMTNNSGFFNVGAFIIVSTTILEVLMIAALVWAITNVNPSTTISSRESNKAVLMFSRTLSILTTTYLVWNGHWILGIVDLLNLVFSFILLFLINELRKEIVTKQNLFRAGGLQ